MKRTFITKFIALVLFVVIALSSQNMVICYASDFVALPSVSLESDFSDDRIIIVLDNKVSLKFKEYSTNDFSLIDCKQVKSLSAATGDLVKRQMENIEQHVTKGQVLEEYDGIDLSDYHQILSVELTTPGKRNVIQAIKKLEQMDGVVVACPNYKIISCMTSNDPHSLDYRNDDGVDYLELIGLYDAWDITTGSSNVNVGIIDSGIDDHPDLVTNLKTELFVNCTSNSSVGAVDCEAFDNCGHGTGVAGVIGAVGNNGIGISGVCWNVSLVSMKVSDEYGDGTVEDLLEAIDYASLNNLDILNISMGNDESLSDLEAIRIQTAINIAMGNFNGLIVCAAGNSSDNNDNKIEYSLTNEPENVIYVGASTSTDSKYSTSCFGKESVDVFAPGYAVLSTMSLSICPNDSRHDTMFAPHYNQEDEGYHLFDSTSFATPFVTGVAALMLSINPNLTAIQLKDIIVRSVDVVPALQNYCISGGRLNAYKAVRTAQMYRFAANTTYSQLEANDTLYTISHGVLYDFCSECTCRTSDYSCDNCDMCDPCEDCHIYYTELHNWNYQIEMGNVYTHRQSCYVCGYIIDSSHNWVLGAEEHECTDCGMTSEFIPGIMSLSDEELALMLATLSDEDLTNLILSLNEDDRGRIAALLPEREDDLVTE